MLTDGITTEGQTIGDVAEFARRKSIPLFLVGLGSDRPPRDLRLTDLLVDDVVFVEEMVNFEAQLRGDGYAGQTAKVKLRRGDRSEVLAAQDVAVPADGASLPVRLSYRPREEGDFEYVLEVEPAEGEVNAVNNRLSQQIRVRDATQRVLLVQSYPSYEYRFLKDLLGRAVRHADGGTARAIQLTTVLQEADLENAREDAAAQSVFPVRREDLFAYDVLVFGDVNPNFLSPSAMEHVVEFVTDRGGGAIFLAGPSFTPLAYRDTPLAKTSAGRYCHRRSAHRRRVAEGTVRRSPHAAGADHAVHATGRNGCRNRVHLAAAHRLALVARRTGRASRRAGPGRTSHPDRSPGRTSAGHPVAVRGRGQSHAACHGRDVSLVTLPRRSTVLFPLLVADSPLSEPLPAGLARGVPGGFDRPAAIPAWRCRARAACDSPTNGRLPRKMTE